MHIRKSCTIKEVFKLNQIIGSKLYIQAETPKQYRNLIESNYKILQSVITYREANSLCCEIHYKELLYMKNELYLMSVENEKDLLYLPDGKVIESKGITDILYYEGLYGKAIYEGEESLGEETQVGKGKNV